MSWKDYEERQRFIAAVLDDVTANGNWQIPARWRAEIDAKFGGEAEFALALYPRWFAILSVRLDPVLEDRPADLAGAAARAAMHLACEQPALFALLAANWALPALEPARLEDRHYLAWAPGAQLTELAAHAERVLGEEWAARGEPAPAAAGRASPRQGLSPSPGLQ